MPARMITDLPVLPPRAPDSHKGTYGKGLVLGGSEGMAGAAVMCAEAALRGGAGMVVIGTPRSILPVIATKTTCPTTHAFSETDAKSFAAHAVLEVVGLLPGCTAVALGPGIGRHPGTCGFVLGLIPRLGLPTVIDADGLNNLSTEIGVLAAKKAPIILTPHPAEMARLAGIATADVQRDRTGVAEAFAAKHGVVVVLKGHRTVVTDARQTWINTTGNPGMATGGAGDVLTGVILALLCQGLEPFRAAQFGVYIHGLAGDLAAENTGEVSLIATDILDALPVAFMRHDHANRLKGSC